MEHQRVKNRLGFVKKAVFVFATACVCVILLEGGLRLFSVVAYPKMMILDKQLGWRHASNVSKVFTNEDGTKALVVQNKYGHRGSQYEYARVAGKRRIMFLGDSFTEGSQVDEKDLFTSILEHSNPTWQIINTGVGGYGTMQEYIYLVKEGLRFQPDVVVLMVYENDLADNCLSFSPGMGPRPYAKLNRGKLNIIEEIDDSEFRDFALPMPFQAFLNANSYLYYFLNVRIYQPVFSTKLKELEKASLRNIENCGRFEIFSEIVRRMHAILKDAGADLRLVAIPTANEIRSGTSERNDMIMEMCRNSDLSCLDLMEPFTQAITSGQKPYFTVDIHWTVVGHQVAAAALLPFMLYQNRNLLPGNKRCTMDLLKAKPNSCGMKTTRRAWISRQAQFVSGEF